MWVPSCSPHVNPHVANIDCSKSKAEIKRERDSKRQAEFDAKSEAVKESKRKVEFNQSLKAKSTALASGAYAQSVAMTARQAETQEIQTQLELLDRFGSVLHGAQVEEFKKATLLRLFQRESFESSLNTLQVDIPVDNKEA